MFLTLKAHLNEMNMQTVDNEDNSDDSNNNSNDNNNDNNSNHSCRRDAKQYVYFFEKYCHLSLPTKFLCVLFVNFVLIQLACNLNMLC